MERLAQYLDDLEDLYFAVGLMAEKIRRGAYLCLILLTSIVFQCGAILLALSRPPLALAVVCLTVVGLLYRAAITDHREPQDAYSPTA